ncbi:MAG TPA: MFS transporter [Solirubrobacteraceae bacterium]|nr:MFS transporter [Solirubrobacteraceae bacterium]
MPSARRGNPFSWRFVAPLYMGSALNPINSSVIATALVPIALALHIPVGRTAVLVSSLYLACAIAQPTAGKLSEAFGPRRVFLGGIVLVLAGGLVGGAGGDLFTLTVARVLIGIGTSCGYPSAMLLVRRRAQSAHLDSPPGNVLGGLAIAGMATVAVGPPIGGLIVGISWRSAFLLNVPLTALAFAMAAVWIPRDAGTTISWRKIAGRVDLLGIVGFGGAVAALLVFLMSLPHPRWIALGIAFALGGALLAWELRATTPFLDLRLLAGNLPLTRTYVRTGVSTIGFYVVLYGVTQWIEAVRGLSVETTGLVLLPMGTVSALVSRPLSNRNLIRRPLIVGAAFMVIGSVATLFLNAHAPVIVIILITLVVGVVIGTTTVGNQTALYMQSPPEVVGTASGLLRTFGYIGSIASATITGIVFRTRVTDAALHDIAWILVGLGAVVLIMTLADRRLPRSAEAVATL